MFAFNHKFYEKPVVKDGVDDDTDEDEEFSKKKRNSPVDYLNIWKENPSSIDANRSKTKLKLVTFLAINFFYSMIVLLISKNIILAGLCYILFLCCFIFVFYENCFSLNDFFGLYVSKFSKINPFKKIVFFFLKERPNILYYTNRADLSTTALIIYEVTGVSEKTKPNWYGFVYSIEKENIPYTYQVVQEPILLKDNKDNEILSRYNKINSINSLKTSIYFALYYKISGILTKNKLYSLENVLENIAVKFETITDSNLYHVKITRLSGKKSIMATRSCVLKAPYSESLEVKLDTIWESSLSNMLTKLCFISLATVLSFVGLVVLNVSPWIITFSEIAIVVIILTVWWPELFSVFTIKELQKEDYIAINPFLDATFYYSKVYPNSAFARLGNNLLIGSRTINLKRAITRFYSDKTDLRSHWKLDNFFRALDGKLIPFAYTVENKPLSFYQFRKESRKFLTDKARKEMERSNVNETLVEHWLDSHSGFFKSIFTVTIYSYAFVDRLDESHLTKLEESLEKSTLALFTAFNINFKNFEMVLLKRQKVISGVQIDSVKNKFIREGTHLNSLIFQGKAVLFLSKIEDMLKKGLETSLPAEFNTPLNLKNFVTFGRTINTEFMRKEVRAGFLLEQIRGLLVTNGTEIEREAFLMKLASELVKTNVPCLIFDFNGNWSRLINLFQKSQFEDRFLYFKLLYNFKIDVLHSDNEFDRDNVKYLEYAFDSYALAFQKDEKSISRVKKSVKRNPEVSLDNSQFNLKVKSEQYLFNNPLSVDFSEIFEDLTEDDFNYFSMNQNYDIDVTVKDFVNSTKTVILDMSTHRDHKKKMFFTFLIVSKIIRYCENAKEFEPKIIVVPGIDLFFNAKFLEKTSNYKKIDEFLVPLLRDKFGFVFTANQVHLLHNTFFNYFQNIIAFKTTDSSDIATFKNVIGLNEMKGSGYYTSTRYNTYQIEYLMNMKLNEVIAKRSDVPQPFPAVVAVKEIASTKPMKYEEIMEYMKKQGYDLGSSQKRLMQLSEKSIFEVDLGKFFKYIKELVNFFTEIGKLEKIALYKSSLQQHLKEALSNRVRKQTKSPKELEKIRNELFDLLLYKGYLEDSSEKDAAGYQTMRTCYKIGSHYRTALKDYEEYRKKLETSVSVDALEKQTDNKFEFDSLGSSEDAQADQENEDQDQNQEREGKEEETEDFERERDAELEQEQEEPKDLNLNLDYIERLKDLYYVIFLVYLYVEKKQFDNAINTIKSSIQLVDFFSQKANYDVAVLRRRISELNASNSEDPNVREKIIEIYDLFSIFFNSIQNNKNSDAKCNNATEV